MPLGEWLGMAIRLLILVGVFLTLLACAIGLLIAAAVSAHEGHWPAALVFGVAALLFLTLIWGH